VDALTPGNLASPPSSPKRKAAFSRFGPDVDFLLDLRNGEDDLGGELDELEVPGSSIHEKLDCAMDERVGTGAFGRTGEYLLVLWICGMLTEGAGSLFSSTGVTTIVEASRVALD